MLLSMKKKKADKLEEKKKTYSDRGHGSLTRFESFENVNCAGQGGQIIASFAGQERRV